MEYSAKSLYQHLFGGVFLFLLMLVFCVKSEEMRDICSSGCVCKANYMDCRWNSLKYPNVTLTREVLNLDLSNNDMRALKTLSFPDTFATLRSLNLSKNYIDTIQADTFAILFSIHVIDLSHNRIANIDDRLIQDNANLSMLNLNGNFIRTMSDKPLLRSLSLRKLSMRRAGITWIDATTFSALPLLEQLDLAINRLSTIDPNSFSFLSQLQSLDLNENMWTCETAPSEMVAKLTKQGVDVKLRACSANKSPIENIKPNALDAKFTEICEQDHMTLCMAYANCLDNYSTFKKIVKYEQSKLFTKSKCIIFAVGVAFGALVGLVMFGIISTCIDKRYGNYKTLSPTSSVSESEHASAISSKPLV